MMLTLGPCARRLRSARIGWPGGRRSPLRSSSRSILTSSHPRIQSSLEGSSCIPSSRGRPVSRSQRSPGCKVMRVRGTLAPISSLHSCTNRRCAAASPWPRRSSDEKGGVSATMPRGSSPSSARAQRPLVRSHDPSRLREAGKTTDPQAGPASRHASRSPGSSSAPRGSGAAGANPEPAPRERAVRQRGERWCDGGRIRARSRRTRAMPFLGHRTAFAASASDAGARVPAV